MFYFFGLGMVLWGRLALGKMYFVSSSLGVQLQKDHELVTHGLYALVRHPMYLGILMVGLGGILLYRTWTLVFVSLNFPVLLLRAKREEEALGEEFGEEWMKYRRRVPAWLPTFMKTSYRKIGQSGGRDGTEMDRKAEK
jgi:protein-S-isoprenylcysteine O-methyltransferase Ste14